MLQFDTPSPHGSSGPISSAQNMCVFTWSLDALEPGAAPEAKKEEVKEEEEEEDMDFDLFG